jgi:hypothetical protein
MSTARSVAWDVRDNRGLSAYAKLAYLMLWSRMPNIHPSMRTLAGDMGVSVRTAHKAVRELEAAGALKTSARMTERGDPDSNEFTLLPLSGLGHAGDAGGSCTTDTTPSAGDAPEVTNYKTPTEGPKRRQGSRRAQPAVSRDEAIHFTREAVACEYGRSEADELSDERALGLWEHLVGDNSPRDPMAYLGKIFTETPYLDTHLAMVEPD